MIQLDVTLIDEIGLSDLDEESKAKLLEVFAQAVELKVGQVVDEKLDDSQIADMMEVIKAEDQPKLTQWLKNNIPDYEEITRKQIELLKGEYTKNPELLRSALDS